LFAILKLFSVVSHNGKNPLLLYPTYGGKPSPLYPTAEKNSSVVSHNRKNLFQCIPQQQKNIKLKWLHEKKIFSKMILIHESGSQEDQLDEKKWRPKIS
jgi:hypothetical protein